MNDIEKQLLNRVSHLRIAKVVVAYDANMEVNEFYEKAFEERKEAWKQSLANSRKNLLKVVKSCNTV